MAKEKITSGNMLHQRLQELKPKEGENGYSVKLRKERAECIVSYINYQRELKLAPVDLKGLDLSYAAFKLLDPKPDLSNIDFSGCNLGHSDFVNVTKMGGSNFSKAIFEGSAFGNNDLSHCSFKETNFTGTRFESVTTITGSDFTNAQGVTFDLLKKAQGIEAAVGVPNDVIEKQQKELKQKADKLISEISTIHAKLEVFVGIFNKDTSIDRLTPEQKRLILPTLYGVFARCADLPPFKQENGEYNELGNSISNNAYAINEAVSARKGKGKLLEEHYSNEEINKRFQELDSIPIQHLPPSFFNGLIAEIILNDLQEIKTKQEDLQKNYAAVVTEEDKKKLEEFPQYDKQLLLDDKVNKLYQALNEETIKNWQKDIRLSIPVPESYTELDQELPDDLLTNKRVLRDFIAEQYGHLDEPVQGFLNDIQKKLDKDNPFKAYKGAQEVARRARHSELKRKQDVHQRFYSEEKKGFNDEITVYIDNWRRDLPDEKVDLSGLDFSGMDLKGMDFEDVDLKGANFTGANLEGANFKGSHLEDVNFTGANLKDATVENTVLTGANFDNATLTNLCIEGAAIPRLEIAKLPGLLSMYIADDEKGTLQPEGAVPIHGFRGLNNNLPHRVGKLCQYMASKEVTDEGRLQLVTAINELLDKNLEKKITTENLGEANDLLLQAIAKQYPDVPNKFEAFLDSLKSNMEKPHPLEMYNDRYQGLKDAKFDVVRKLRLDWDSKPVVMGIDHDRRLGDYSSYLSAIKDNIPQFSRFTRNTHNKIGKTAGLIVAQLEKFETQLKPSDGGMALAGSEELVKAVESNKKAIQCMKDAAESTSLGERLGYRRQARKYANEANKWIKKSAKHFEQHTKASIEHENKLASKEGLEESRTEILGEKDIVKQRDSSPFEDDDLPRKPTKYKDNASLLSEGEPYTKERVEQVRNKLPIQKEFDEEKIEILEEEGKIKKEKHKYTTHTKKEIASSEKKSEEMSPEILEQKIEAQRKKLQHAKNKLETVKGESSSILPWLVVIGEVGGVGVFLATIVAGPIGFAAALGATALVLAGTAIGKKLYEKYQENSANKEVKIQEKALKTLEKKLSSLEKEKSIDPKEKGHEKKDFNEILQEEDISTSISLDSNKYSKKYPPSSKKDKLKTPYQSL